LKGKNFETNLREDSRQMAIVDKKSQEYAKKPIHGLPSDFRMKP
jgi:hypothetical protein